MATSRARRRKTFAHHDKREQGLPQRALGKIEQPLSLGCLSKMLFALRVIGHRFGFGEGAPSKGIGGGKERLLPFP